MRNKKLFSALGLSVILAQLVSGCGEKTEVKPIEFEQPEQPVVVEPTENDNNGEYVIVDDTIANEEKTEEEIAEELGAFLELSEAIQSTGGVGNGTVSTQTPTTSTPVTSQPQVVEQFPASVGTLPDGRQVPLTKEGFDSVSYYNENGYLVTPSFDAYGNFYGWTIHDGRGDGFRVQ